MSDFKIIGNPDPVVGKEEFYSVNTFLPSILPFQNSASNNSFEQPVKWEIYILENGRWRKTKENDKTGKRISYTFLQKSLERKGIRILARRGEDVARLNITSHPAEKPKIESIELLDKNGQKPSKPLSYGQTLKARVNCLHMEKHKVYVTLWEDDAAGAGHNKANEKNIIQTLSGVVKNGKADVDFLLRPSFAKIAKQNGPEEGKIHEYYVTTDFNKNKIASNNVNVNDLETPVAPYKAKVPVQQPSAPKPKASVPQPTQPKTKASASGSTTAPKVKAAITRVHLTDTAGRAISGVFKDKEIKVWIDSQGLIDKEIRLKLYDEDGISDDLLFDEKFTIKSNIYAVVVPLNKIPRSKGGGYWGEGAEQEVFAYVEVVQDASMHKQSAVVDVDAKVFKPDPVEHTNKAAKIGEDDKQGAKNCGEKYCISKNSPASELIREINIRLAGFGGNVPTDKFTDRTEKMIKQFQRDYMKVPETGKVCGSVLKAIDDFSEKWYEKVLNYKCLCHASDSKVPVKDRCSSGYGKGLKDEHPGVHRSLLWSVSALKYYLSVQKKYSFNNISAGYRCWAHNKSIPRTSTNHMGKAVDIQFRVNGIKISGKDKKNIKELEQIRDLFYVKYLKAEEGWTVKNPVFRLEPIGLGKDESYSWIHMDVTKFSDYLDDKYFVKDQKDVEGGKLVKKALELRLNNLCNCGGFKPNKQQNSQSKKSKYKWAHSEFGNLIAQNESKDNYNICNKTKGGLKIVNNVDVIGTSIKDIVSKQKSRDIFAVGRYQLIPVTLNAAIESLGLDLDSKLDEETQDKIFDEYLIKAKRPDIINYLEGNGTINLAMYASAKEWASIGVEKGMRISDKKIKKGKKIIYEKRYAEGGESYYAGDGLNKAHITPQEIKNALTNSKK